MRSYVRMVFAFNAVYQTVLGLFCMLAPEVMIRLYGLQLSAEGDVMLQVTFRLLGVKLIPFGVISALIAGNPDDAPVLRAIMGLFSVLTLICYGIVVGMYELHISWIGIVSLNVLSQVLVLIAVVFYTGKKKVPQIITRSRRVA